MTGDVCLCREQFVLIMKIDVFRNCFLLFGSCAPVRIVLVAYYQNRSEDYSPPSYPFSHLFTSDRISPDSETSASFRSVTEIFQTQLDRKAIKRNRLKVMHTNRCVQSERCGSKMSWQVSAAISVHLELGFQRITIQIIIRPLWRPVRSCHVDTD